MLLDHCGPSQNHLFSLKITQPHIDCLPNCCDMIGYLPKLITNQILSYLDPVSLATCSRVNRHWYQISNDSQLWKRFCFILRWRFSAGSEAMQLKKVRKFYIWPKSNNHPFILFAQVNIIWVSIILFETLNNSIILCIKFILVDVGHGRDEWTCGLEEHIWGEV